MNTKCRKILDDLEKQGRIKTSDYEFPKPFPLDKKLADVLEDEVDEKYYINNEKAQKLIQKLIDNGTLANTIATDRQTDRQTDVALTEQSVNQPKEKLQTVSSSMTRRN